jgi:hypothetical protein
MRHQAGVVNEFELVGSYFSENPQSYSLRVFRFNHDTLFVLKPDLLAVLGLKNPKLLLIQKADIDAEQFKIWAKNQGLKFGNKLANFITVNKSLADFLFKFDVIVKVSITLSSIFNLKGFNDLSTKVLNDFSTFLDYCLSQDCIYMIQFHSNLFMISMKFIFLDNTIINHYPIYNS